MPNTSGNQLNMTQTARYERNFYLQDTIDVARALLGSRLYTCHNGEVTGGIIVETEAYIGIIDKASHSYKGKRTKRNEIQFGPGGYAYIYFVYGKYHQFCVVTGEDSRPDVVLIRALEPINGIDIMRTRRNISDTKKLTNGPGKLCISLNITGDLYGADLCGESIWISPSEIKVDKHNIISSKRIGIDYAEEFIDKEWRFYIKGNVYVSMT